jgi:signal transduction histidine kinase
MKIGRKLLRTRDFISICGGSLKVKSVPGKGSTFTIRMNKS